MRKYYSVYSMCLLVIALLASSGCSKAGTPQKALDIYFSSAVKQDYAAAYDCYYAAYKAKISKDDYIKHRKEASVLQAYKILSLQQTGNTAQAEVQLTFGPSEKLKRNEPVSVKVKEDLVKEGGDWKIKVW